MGLEFLLALAAGCSDYQLYYIRDELSVGTPVGKQEVVSECKMPLDKVLCEGDAACEDSWAQAGDAFTEAQKVVVEFAGYSLDEYDSGEAPITLYTLSTSDSGWAKGADDLEYSDMQISMADNTSVFEDPINISPDNNLSRTRCEAYEDEYGTLVRSIKVYVAQPEFSVSVAGADPVISHQVFETNNWFDDIEITGQSLQWCAGDETVSCSCGQADIEYQDATYSQSTAYVELAGIVTNSNDIADALSQDTITDDRSYGLYYLE